GAVRFEVAEAYAFSARELPLRVAGGALLRLAAPGGRYALAAVDEGLAARLGRRALGVTAVDEPAAPRPLTVAEQGGFAFLVAALVDGSSLRVDGFVERPDDGPPDLAPLFPDPWVLALEARLRTPV